MKYYFYYSDLYNFFLSIPLSENRMRKGNFLYCLFIYLLLNIVYLKKIMTYVFVYYENDPFYFESTENNTHAT